ncbi:MAG TPA: hypothetical protein VGX25_17650 [Actinophytocola sp.]|nr:hypothetical protein [Actinophytocola sp.]HEV2781209.1 hypothetical protein [Actinophytocola sp.]
MTEQAADGQETRMEFRGAQFSETDEQIDVVEVEEIQGEEVPS